MKRQIRRQALLNPRGTNSNHCRTLQAKQGNEETGIQDGRRRTAPNIHAMRVAAAKQTTLGHLGNASGNKAAQKNATVRPDSSGREDSGDGSGCDGSTQSSENSSKVTDSGTSTETSESEDASDIGRSLSGEQAPPAQKTPSIPTLGAQPAFRQHGTSSRFADAANPKQICAVPQNNAEAKCVSKAVSPKAARAAVPAEHPATEKTPVPVHKICNGYGVSEHRKCAIEAFPELVSGTKFAPIGL